MLQKSTQIVLGQSFHKCVFCFSTVPFSKYSHIVQHGIDEQICSRCTCFLLTASLLCHSFKGSPFLKCVVSMALPKQLETLPPSVKQAPWSTFFGPYFLHLFFDIARNELKSAQTILASVLKSPKTRNCPFGCGKKCSKPSRQAFTPTPLTSNAHGNNTCQKGASLKRTLLKNKYPTAVCSWCQSHYTSNISCFLVKYQHSN